MRLINLRIRLIIPIVFIMIIGGCSKQSQVDLLRSRLPVQENNTPFVSKKSSGAVPSYYSPLNNSTDIVRDYFEVIAALNIHEKSKVSYLLSAHRAMIKETELKKANMFSYDYLNYLPGDSLFFSKDDLFSVYAENIRVEPHSNKPSFASHMNYKERVTMVNSPHFNFKFSFPKDFIGFTHVDYNGYSKIDSSDIFIPEPLSCCYTSVRNTTLSLPLSIPVKRFEYSPELESESKRLKLIPLSEFQENSTYIELNRDTLQLNPAFVSSYQESIEFLWQLYLFNINYNIIGGDTLYCDVARWIPPNSERSEFIRKVSFWLFPFNDWEYIGSEARCYPVLFSDETKDYLKEAFKKDPKLYTSYFELILWQIFQPTNFRVLDNKGKKSSLVFSSNDYRFTGDYKIKFDLVHPYHFKVSKL